MFKLHDAFYFNYDTISNNWQNLYHIYWKYRRILFLSPKKTRYVLVDATEKHNPRSSFQMDKHNQCSLCLWHDSHLIDKQNVTLSYRTYMSVNGLIYIWKTLWTGGWNMWHVKNYHIGFIVLFFQTHRLNPIVMIILLFYLVAYFAIKRDDNGWAFQWWKSGLYNFIGMALKLLSYVFCLFFLVFVWNFFFHFLKIKHHTRFKWKKLSFQRICWVTRVWIANLSRYLSNCDETFKRYDYFMTAFKTTSGNSLWRNFKPHSCHFVGSFLFTKPNMRFTIFEQKINSHTINFALPLCVIIMILTLVHCTTETNSDK